MALTPTEFYERLVNLAKDKDIPIRQLEIKAGIPLGTVKRWKKAIPAGDTIVKIADELDVSIDYLLGRTDEPLAHKTSKFSNSDRVILALRQNNLPDNVLEALVAFVNIIGDEL